MIGSVALLAVGVVGYAPISPAAAATRTSIPGQVASARPDTAKPGKQPTSRRLSLLTGDVVTVHTGPDGRQAVIMDPDGPSHGSVRVFRQADDTYAVPFAAQSAVAAAAVDLSVFNVSELIRDGYTRTTPVLVTGRRGKLPSAPSHARVTRKLQGLGAVAASVPQANAASFWRAYDTAAEQSAAGIGKIWLDRKVHTDLLESVPQVGAPTAWQAGYDGKGVKVAVLDTGVDATHPDLVGRIAEARNFAAGAHDVVDRFGHGTHVAATIAGSGSDSGRKGVAPGARLVIGKVLGDDGYGSMSDVIAGMQWAASSGASVINVSLGDDQPSDGLDPMAQAVDELSEQTGVLFVIAAGNSGRRGIGSPASAADALTVGAVDKNDKLADFSTRGPREGDVAVKPELSAPGVDIIAARAAGTSMGEPVDALYTKASGTSMATPHVAGAAAILKQVHPQWTGQQLKAGLVSTAQPLPNPVIDGGAGRVDIARATVQQAYATPASLNFGSLHYVEDGTYQPITKEVIIHNDADTARTFTASAAGVDGAGKPLPASTIAVTATPVTVAAHGQAAVSVRLDPNHLTRGLDVFYSGRVSAVDQGGKALVTVPFAFGMEQVMHDLTITGFAPDGKPANAPSTALLWDLDRTVVKRVTFHNGVARARLLPSRYAVDAVIYAMDPNGRDMAGAMQWVAPSVVSVNGDVSLTADGRKARKVVVDVGRPAEQRALGFSYQDVIEYLDPAASLYVLPTPAKDVKLDLYSTLTAPRLTASAPGLSLHPTLLPGGTIFAGDRTLPLVAAGNGAPGDYDAARAKGALLLIKHSATPIADVLNLAAERGAAGVALVNDGPGRLTDPAGTAVLPVFSLSAQEGGQLLDQLGHGPVNLHLVGIPDSPWQYDLDEPIAGPVPDGAGPIVFTATAKNTAKITATYYARGRSTAGSTIHTIRGTGSLPSYYYASEIPIHFGTVREEWVTADPSVDYVFGATFPDTEPFWSTSSRWGTVFTPGTSSAVNWFKQVSNPRDVEGWLARDNRQGTDYLIIGAVPFPDADAHFAMPSNDDVYDLSLYRDGKKIGTTDYFFGDSFKIDKAPYTYTAVLETKRIDPGWVYSPTSTTTWTFNSGTRPVDDRSISMPQIRYDAPVDLTNRVKAAATHTLVVHADPKVKGEPAVRTVSSWVSFDDGKTWTALTLSRGSDGYTATVTVPALQSTSGYVSVRTQAVDAAGHAVDQKVIRAYGLS